LSKITPVILSGGSGTRLWPLSRREYPKQFLSLAGNQSMLQETILRLIGIEGILDPIIVCNSEHRFIVAEQCQQIGLNNPMILLEPVARNTAPAIAAASMQQINSSIDSILLVLPADHVIQDKDAFHAALLSASHQASLGKLVTFGITPASANTEYGYIKLSKDIINGAHKVEEFFEKPNKKNAEIYLKEGDYLWNSGMFMFRSSSLIKELNKYAPNIVKSVKNAIDSASKDLDFIRLDKSNFEKSPAKSIDTAIMEKSKKAVVIPMDAGWSDLGSWSALYEVGSKDKNGNVLNGDVIAIDTNNSYVNSENNLIAIIGVDNVFVINTPDVTFIASKNRVTQVKKVVEFMQANGRIETMSHRKVYRPWGWFDLIETGKYYQVKKLHVNPGAKLSLQMHKKRAEHWVVIIGEASVTNDENQYTLTKGESTYIPMGISHSLENKTDYPLEVIEVQSGTYLGEDDIYRFEDIYGRANFEK
jgi:mannose-1-phosphate guanylyltransferase / mannose-6-phosphate isomerase